MLVKNVEIKAELRSEKWLSKVYEDLSLDAQRVCFNSYIRWCTPDIPVLAVSTKENCEKQAVSTAERPHGLPIEAYTILLHALVLDT